MNTGHAMSAFREYRTLLRVHLRTQLGLSVLRANWKHGKGRAKTIGLAAAMVYAFGAMLLVYILILNAVFSGIAALEDAGLVVPGLEEALMGSVLTSAMTISFILGSITLFSVVFHARDAALYASMPLRPGSVFAAKFSTVYGYELLFTLFITVPAGLIYSLRAEPAGGAVLFWLRLVPVILTLPMTPLALAALAALGLSRVTRGARRYERWNLVFQLLLLAAVMGFQLLMSGPLAQMMSGDAMQGFLLEQSQKLTSLPGWFPPAAWAGRAVMETGLPALSGAGLYVLVSAGCMALALALAGRVYNRGMQAQSEVPRTAVRGQAKTSAPSSSARAIARKEWRILRRTAVYAMNTMIGPFILPIMLVFMLVGQGSAVDELLKLINGLGEAATALLMGVIMSLSMMISGASTMFSREGKGLESLNALPLQARDIVRGKLSCYRQIGWAGVLLTAVPLFILRVPVLPVLAGAVMAACAVWPIIEAHAIRDAASPKLDWENETQAVKQNMNALVGMLAAFVAALPIVGVALMMVLLTESVWLTVLAAAAVSALMTVPLRKWNIHLTERLIRGG